MAETAGEMTVAQRLGQALDRGQLPAGGPAEAAERLIERLERPARVALLGLPGAGKSAVLNLLAGETVINETLRLPTVLVQRGADERMVCTLPDGTTQVVPGRGLEEIVPLNPALVTLELQLPALSVISLLEVSAGPAESDQRRAAAWASKRADIVVWCSTSFLPKEQTIWESLPDAIKDNGFLFLSKTDLMGAREAVAGMVDRVEQRAGEEFRQVLPISVLNARKAMQAPGGIDRAMFRESGASAVIMAIKSRVEMARRADTDMADLLLSRHASDPEPPTRRMADPVPEVVAPPVAVPEILADAPLPQPVVEADPVSEIEPVFEAEAEPEAKPEPEAGPTEPDAPRRFSDRIRQMLPAYEAPVYQPPAPPRPTLGKQPVLLSEVAPVAKAAPKGDPLRAIFARSDEEKDEAALGADPTDRGTVPDLTPEPEAEIEAPEPLPTPQPGRERVRVRSRTLPPDEPVAPPEPVPAERPNKRERPRIAARAAVTVAPRAATAPLGDDDRAILDTAIGVIMQRAGQLADSLAGVDKIPVDEVLDHGRETAEQVATLLGASQASQVRRIAADLGEVQDLIMLMQLEKGHAPADDAVTLILQLRRDLETIKAA
jgi:hypothetical protein